MIGKMDCGVVYQSDSLHIFAENANASKHNHQNLQSISGDLYTVTVAVDHLPKNVLNHELNEVPSGNQKETDGLAQILEVQVAARVMLTVDIDLQKRLVNGKLGTVKHISWGSTKNTIKIYVNFNGDKDWIKRMNTGNFTEQHFWVPK